MITMSCTCQGLSHLHMHSDTPLEDPARGGYNVVVRILITRQVPFQIPLHRQPSCRSEED
jgi:hypothetical protein